MRGAGLRIRIQADDLEAQLSERAAHRAGAAEELQQPHLLLGRRIFDSTDQAFFRWLSQKMAAIDFDRLTIGELVTSGKGAKSAPLGYGKEAVAWLPEDVMTVAYEPGVFSGEDVARVNLSLRPSDAVQGQLVELDEWIVATVAANSERLLGKAQTLEQVRARYAPTLKLSDKGYAPTMKCKMNKSGRGAVKIWDGKQLREEPEAWAGSTVKVRLLLKSLYIMGANFGVVLDVTDVSIVSAPVTDCPF